MTLNETSVGIAVFHSTIKTLTVVYCLDLYFTRVKCQEEFPQRSKAQHINIITCVSYVISKIDHWFNFLLGT